ncbi:hypothetical protein DFJ73DRAFT_88315 [Zopfochytrium polystomum]|nr:hypothetical protein DFJ73DRAFT_88315 [Zopfochytrium polystomum]
MDFVSSSNQLLAGALLSFSIGICFREQIGKIQTWHLSGSIWIALGCYFLYGVSAAVEQRLFVSATPETVQFLFQVGYLPLFLSTVTFSALTYHTSYRALILLLPQKQQWLWIVSGAFTLVEFSLNIADATLYNRNLTANFGAVPDPNEQKTSITLIVYVIITDTIFFGASQARIVTVMRELNKVKVSPWLYVEAAFRCICYSGAVLLFFTTAGSFFFPTTEAWVFLSISPSIMLMVLLTDADRVRKLVARMQGNVSVSSSSPLKSIDSNGSRRASSRPQA